MCLWAKTSDGTHGGDDADKLQVLHLTDMDMVQGVGEFRVSLAFTGVHWGSQEFAGVCRSLQEFTGVCRS